MVNEPALYNYQEKAVEEVIEAWNIHQSVMLQMPTGTGKTHVFCEIIRRKNVGTLILAHRIELIKQIQERLADLNIIAGIIMGGQQYNPEYEIQVASISSLNQSKEYPKNISLIVIDEAHHSTAISYNKILEFYRNIKDLKILGVTATPCRLDGSGFNSIYETLIVSKSIKTFIKNNMLANIKHLATSIPNLKNISLGIGKNGIDYVDSQLSDYMINDKTIMSELIESYKKYSNNKKCIVFAVDKKHSKSIVERYIAEGIKAEFIDSDTPPDSRRQIIEKFKLGEFQVLCNVEIFTEGFDCPDIEVVQLARPTKSLILYLQMVGRGLRNKNNQSKQLLILDNAGLWKTHGLITKEHLWTLNGIEKSYDTIAIKDPDTKEVKEQERPKNIIEIFGLGMDLIEDLYDENDCFKISILNTEITKTGEGKYTKIIPKLIQSIYQDEQLNNLFAEIISQENPSTKINLSLKIESNLFKDELKFNINNSMPLKDTKDLVTNLVKYKIELEEKNKINTTLNVIFDHALTFKVTEIGTSKSVIVNGRLRKDNYIIEQKLERENVKESIQKFAESIKKANTEISNFTKPDFKILYNGTYLVIKDIYINAFLGIYHASKHSMDKSFLLPCLIKELIKITDDIQLKIDLSILTFDKQFSYKEQFVEKMKVNKIVSEDSAYGVYMKAVKDAKKRGIQPPKLPNI